MDALPESNTVYDCVDQAVPTWVENRQSLKIRDRYFRFSRTPNQVTSFVAWYFTCPAFRPEK